MAESKKIETFDDAKGAMREALFPGSKPHDLSKPPEELTGGQREPQDMPDAGKPAAGDSDADKKAKIDAEAKAKEEAEKAEKEKGKTPEQIEAEKKAAATAAKPKRVKKSSTDKSAEALTEAAKAITTAAHAMTAKPADKPAGDKPADDEVPAGRKDDLAIFAELENIDPKYKGKKAEYIAFAHKEDSYIKQWEAANTGKQFDPEAEEHSEWYDANEPEVSDRDLRRAEIRLEARPLAEQLAEDRTKGLKEKLDQFEVADTIRGTQPKIEQSVAIAVSAALEAMSPDILKLAGEKGQEELSKAHPEAAAVLHEMAPQIVGVVDAAIKIFETNGRAFDSKNAFHQEVVDTAVDLEKQLLAFDEEQLTKPDGTVFTTRQKWNSMPAEEREKHWIIGSQEVNLALANKYAAKAKEGYEKRVKDVESGATARGWTKPAPAKAADNSTANGKAAEEDKAAAGEEDGDKPNSPSTSSSTVHRPGEATPGKKDEKALDFMGKGMFGR